MTMQSLLRGPFSQLITFILLTQLCSCTAHKGSGDGGAVEVCQNNEAFEWHAGFVPESDFDNSRIKAIDIWDADVERIAQQGSVQDVDLLFCRRISSESVKQLWRLPHLRSISFYGCNQLADEAFFDIHCATSLSRINIGRCDKLTGSNWFARLGSVVHRLTHLEISYCKSLDSLLLDDLLLAVEIQELTAIECDAVSDRALSILAKQQVLTGINLARIKSTTEKGIAALCDCVSLKELQVYETSGVTDESLSRISALVNLEFLAIRGTSVSDRTLAVLAELPKLAKVNVCYCSNITLAGLERLLDSTTLSELWVTSSPTLSVDSLTLLASRHSNMTLFVLR